VARGSSRWKLGAAALEWWRLGAAALARWKLVGAAWARQSQVGGSTAKEKAMAVSGAAATATAEEKATTMCQWWVMIEEKATVVSGVAATAEGKATATHRQIWAAWQRNLWNPPVSRVSTRETLFYIGGSSFMSVILTWPTPKITIFGVGYLYTADTNNYWYRLYKDSQHQ
jgi:hypothetical protein